MSEPKFYALIIGTEILNRRREDKHFDFLSKILAQKGHKLSGSFIIEDNPTLIVDTIKFIALQKNSILFSFGGIGSTPDDYTRLCAAIALSDGELQTHPEIKNTIEERLGEKAYPYAIRMAEVPKGSDVLDNDFNGMPAFSLESRFYFMPGFPEMSHPMVTKILENEIEDSSTYYRYTLEAQCKESELIEAMEMMPEGVEFSSLPKVRQKGWSVSMSVASYDKKLAKTAFGIYIDMLEQKSIDYIIKG
ncbi:MAG: molybdopterin-binding protein [Sulfurovum sp.]